MRRFYAFIAAFTLLAGLVTSLGRQAPAAAADPPKPYGGSVVVLESDEPPLLNPFLEGGSNAGVGIIGQSYFTGVWNVDATTLELIPEVVYELPTVENGGIFLPGDGTMMIEYTIRDEAVWSDGTPISGHDFEFTYNIITGGFNGIDIPIENPDPYLGIVPGSVSGADKTFEYTMDSVTTAHELLFGTLIPAHAVDPETFENDWNTTIWPSGGPFSFVEWVKGDYLVVERNPNYWMTDADTGQALPYLDEVIFKFAMNQTELLDAFAAREADIVAPDATDAALVFLHDLQVSGADAQVRSGPVWEHLNFSLGPGRLSRNPQSMNEHRRFRQAIAYGVNGEAIVADLYNGMIDPLDSYLAPYSPTLTTNPWM